MRSSEGPNVRASTARDYREVDIIRFTRRSRNGAVPDEILAAPIRGELVREIAGEHVSAEPCAVGATTPARGLHRIAERVDADLIVVGSAHRGPLGRAVVGDDALATIHRSPCPVAVAPRGGAAPAQSPSHIAVGYDRDAESDAALALAAKLARATGAALQVISVVVTPVEILPPAGEPAWLARRRKTAEQRLERAVGSLDLQVSTAMPMGDPDEALVQLSHRVDLLILGSRGFGRVRRVIVSSTTAGVIHGAGCAVIVVPRGAEKGGIAEREGAHAQTAPSP